jgi:AcrR family transcriptional regulator
MALMQEQPFDSITVEQVLERAGVGRSTFYNHFRGKDDLFFSNVEDFFELASTALTRAGDKSNRVAPVREFFAHVADSRRFLTVIVESKKFQDVMEMGQGYGRTLLGLRLEEVWRPTRTPEEESDSSNQLACGKEGD